MTRSTSKLFDEVIEDLSIKYDFNKLLNEYKKNKEFIGINSTIKLLLQVF